MLWVEGHAAVRHRAERMNFVAGARWDESHAGTNAPGTALAVDHAVQIFAAEHFAARAAWTCAAAPIHDPHTGRLLGAVDITGGDHWPPRTAWPWSRPPPAPPRPSWAPRSHRHAGRGTV